MTIPSLLLMKPGQLRIRSISLTQLLHANLISDLLSPQKVCLLQVPIKILRSIYSEYSFDNNQLSTTQINQRPAHYPTGKLKVSIKHQCLLQ